MAIDTLTIALEQRRDVELRIMAALQHVPRDRAMSIIMSFIPLEELEDIADFQEGRS